MHTHMNTHKYDGENCKKNHKWNSYRMVCKGTIIYLHQKSQFIQLASQSHRVLWYVYLFHPLGNVF